MSTENTAVNQEAKFKRVIQAKDENGNPVGAPQVFYADTEQELIDKLAQAQEHATLKIRTQAQQLKRPAEKLKDAELAREQVTFQPRPLTADERFEMSTNVNDPDKVDQAFDKAFEAKFGAPVEKVREVISQGARDAEQTRALAEVNAFTSEYPQYKICPQNSKMMMDFIVQNQLAVTKKNLELAFSELSNDGLLLLSGVEPELLSEPDAEEHIAQPEVEEIPQPAPAQPVARPRPVATAATSLTRANSSASNVRKPKTPSVEEQAKHANMSAAEYYEKVVKPEHEARIRQAQRNR